MTEHDATPIDPDLEALVSGRLRAAADHVVVRPDADAVLTSDPAIGAGRRARGVWLAAAAAAAVVLGIGLARDDAGEVTTIAPTTTVPATTAPDVEDAFTEIDGPWQAVDEAWLAPRRPADTPAEAIEAAAVQFLAWSADAEPVEGGDPSEWWVIDRDGDRRVRATVARRIAGWVVTRLGEPVTADIVDETARIELTAGVDRTIHWRSLNTDDGHAALDETMATGALTLPVAVGSPRPDTIVWHLDDDGEIVEIRMYLFGVDGADPLDGPRFGDGLLAPARFRTTHTPTAGVSAAGLGVVRMPVDFADTSRFVLELPARLDGAVGVEHSRAGARLVGVDLGLEVSAGVGCVAGRAGAGGLIVARDADDSDGFRACLPEHGIEVSGEITDLTDADLDALSLSPVRLAPDTRMLVAGHTTFGGALELGPGPIGPVAFDDLTLTVDTVNGRLVARDADGAVVWARVVDDARIRTAVDDGIVLVGDDAVTAIGSDGSAAWTVGLDAPYRANAVVELDDGDIVLAVHDPAPGGRLPPRLIRLDPLTGDERWSGEVRPGTDWQWADPLLVDGLVILMDVPNEPDAPEATLWAIRLDDGAPAWSVPLDNVSEVFRTDMLLALADDGQVIAENVGNRTFSIDPADGSIRWSVRSGSGIRLVDEPDGQVLIDQGGGIDLATGQRFGLD